MAISRRIKGDSAKDMKRIGFQRATRTINVMLCLSMISCLAFMWVYQDMYYSSFMYEIQKARYVVLWSWLIVLIYCNVRNSGNFKKLFPLFSNRWFCHTAYGVVFASIGVFTLHNPITIAIYQSYQEHLCNGCDFIITPTRLLYLIVVNCAMCFAMLPLGIINSIIAVVEVESEE
ncbi:hypothetical protein GGI20_005676 [Coemansia sp. BCRC 34301]|nr:hypothetical protein GGI20_005676 [Coemansia sp. BCRC 34301]